MLKGTNFKGKTEPFRRSSLIFADFPRKLNVWDFRRKQQETVDCRLSSWVCVLEHGRAKGQLGDGQKSILNPSIISLVHAWNQSTIGPTGCSSQHAVPDFFGQGQGCSALQPSSKAGGLIRCFAPDVGCSVKDPAWSILGDVLYNVLVGSFLLLDSLVLQQSTQINRSSKIALLY